MGTLRPLLLIAAVALAAPLPAAARDPTATAPRADLSLEYQKVVRGAEYKDVGRHAVRGREARAKRHPYQQVLLFKDVSAPARRPLVTFSLAIRTGKGWFRFEPLGTTGVRPDGKGGTVATRFEPLRFEVANVVPSGNAEVVLEYEQRTGAVKERLLVVCGVGPSGLASCTRPVLVSRASPVAADVVEGRIEFIPEGRMELRRGMDLVSSWLLAFP